MTDTKKNPDGIQLSEIVSPLLSWYAVNKRDLPWRHAVTPYRVLVSEIMLQQTRVETVLAYYDRFLRELPTLQTLADAPETILMKLWEGLGYYSRARNLQKTAQFILDRCQGNFPDSFDALLTLPGIGEYTAGAIASIAFGKPVPAVDGNVLRVLCRLTENRGDIRTAKTKAEIRMALQKIHPPEHSADFTQALMELGAIQCLPNGRPECLRCPLKKHCLAFAHGTVAQIPRKAPAAIRKIEKKAVLLLVCNGKVAVRQRPENGLLAGLWEFPMLTGWPNQTEVETYLKQNGIECKALAETIRAKHLFSHLEWHLHGWKAECSSANPHWQWITPENLHNAIPLPTALHPFRKLL